MSSTTRIPKAEITGLYGYLLKRFTRKLLGDVPEPAEVMWHNRSVLASFTGFGRKAQKWDRLDPNLKSYAHMAVAAAPAGAGQRRGAAGGRGPVPRRHPKRRPAKPA